MADAVEAPPAPVVRLSPAQASSFADALAALSQQAHVAFVAEGQPLHPTLTPAQAARLPLDPQGLPLSRAVDLVAAAYDYTAQRSGPVFRLRKRYTDTDDLPDVTLAECYLDAEDAQALIDRFASVIGEGGPPPMATVLPGIQLSPEQVKAAQDGTGVPVTALPPDQRQSLEGFLIQSDGHYPRVIVKTGIDYLKKVAQGDPRLCWRDVSALSPTVTGTEGLRAFGFVEATLPNIVDVKPQLAFNLMSNPSGIGDGGVTNGAGRGLVLATDGHHRFVRRGRDASDPDPTQPPPLMGASLGQIVAALPPGGPGDPPLAVEDCLKPKRALVVGGQSAAPRQILDALAALYGLRVRPEDPYGLRTPGQGVGRLVLSRPRPNVLQDVTGLGSAVSQTLPDAMMRALRAHWNSLHAAAVRELRTVAEPKIAASADGQVALSTLSDRERAAFAVATANDLLEGFGDLSTGGSPLLTHFDDITLVGQSYDKPQGAGYALFTKLIEHSDHGSLTSLFGPVGSLDPPAH